LVRVAHIGIREGPEELTFADIAALTVDHSGSVYVLDRGMRSLRQYGSDGTFIRTVATYGTGPGELRGPVGLDILPHGGIVVRDGESSTINAYSQSGAYVRSWRIAGGRVPRGQSAVRTLTNGLVVRGLPTAYEGNGSEIWPRALAEVLDSAGVVVDTLWGPARSVERCTRGERRFREGMEEDLRATYQPKVTWTVMRSGSLVIGCPATGAFDVMSRSGAVLRITRSDWPVVTVGRRERTEIPDFYEAEGRRRGRGRDWSGVEIPSNKPAYRLILASDDNRVWVFLPRPSEEVQAPSGKTPPGSPASYWWEGRARYARVFDDRGSFLGTVELPGSFVLNPNVPDSPPPFIRGDSVWAVTDDSASVQYVTKFVVAARSRAQPDQ
jgi:hypothetical protein